jgi:hypothetical protein
MENISAGSIVYISRKSKFSNHINYNVKPGYYIVIDVTPDHIGNILTLDRKWYGTSFGPRIASSSQFIHLHLPA